MNASERENDGLKSTWGEDLPQHLLEYEEDYLEVDRLGRVLLEELFSHL